MRPDEPPLTTDEERPQALRRRIATLDAARLELVRRVRDLEAAALAETGIALARQRALATTTAVDRSMVRLVDEGELLKAVCDIAVDIGGYRMAWVGLAESDAARTVRPAASAGHEADYLRNIHVTWGDDPHGQCPIGTAIRTGRPDVAQRIDADPRLAPWRDEALRRGYASCAALPLMAKDGCLGALAVYSADPGGFDAQEMELLVELAGDLAYAVDAIRTRRALHATEDQLRQAQKLEAIGRLAGGVAHDFNNLLTVISGHAQLMLAAVDPADPLVSGLRHILGCADRAAALTRQLLAFGRKQVLEPRNLDLNGILSGIERMLRRIIGEDVDFTCRPAPDLWTVYVDPGQVEQVILNLVVNARDAMPQGGRLVIETANAVLDGHYVRTHPDVRPGEYAMLAVSDSGCGMTPETLARLFEPFFTTKPRGRGTGLGLATAYGIVKQSGGYIWPYSEPGRGATFKVYLPRVPEPAESITAAPHPSPHRGGTETVLVVEDDDGVRELVARVLSANGYRVIQAENAGAALLACEQQPEDVALVLTDVVMPQMGGRQLIERLQAIRPGILPLYMSGYADNAVGHHGRLDPGTAFLQKPFSPGRLLSKVRDVIDAAKPNPAP